VSIKERQAVHLNTVSGEKEEGIRLALAIASTLRLLGAEAE
jgi:hypothetical protein